MDVLSIVPNKTNEKQTYEHVKDIESFSKNDIEEYSLMFNVHPTYLPPISIV